MATRSASITIRPRARPRARQASVTDRFASGSILLTIITMVLVFLGLIMILSSSMVSSLTSNGSSFFFLKKQLMWGAIGLVGFVAFMRLDYRKFRGVGYLLVPLVLLLLVAVLVPGVGTTVGGSSRWLGLGPLTFQPSEFAKLALILFAADVLSRKKEITLDNVWHTMLPIVPVMGAMALLVILQPDLGTTLMIGAIGLGMLFVAGAPLRYVLPLGAVALAMATMASLAAPYRRARVMAFLDPWADPLNTGYQTIQGLIALGSGGWFGVGLGASRQKWNYIPNAHTDYIFSILGEEMGLFGTFVVLGMFAALAYLGIRTARKAPDRFGMFLAAGITIVVSFQAVVNIGAVTATLPITGVPLPLVSFGGSSLVITLISMGVLTNIARQSEGLGRRKKKPAARRSTRSRA
ncbi:MAG: putative lipid II flippase FtsW [Actinomycetota bacterium]|nr:putative lipid II flippase FtsW [Actinomycetota bacterium]